MYLCRTLSAKRGFRVDHPAVGRQGRYYSVQETALRFGISERHCRRLLRQKKLPATKLEPNGAWRVPDFIFDTEFMLAHMSWNFQRSIEARQKAAGRTTTSKFDDPEYVKMLIDAVTKA